MQLSLQLYLDKDIKSQTSGTVVVLPNNIAVDGIIVGIANTNVQWGVIGKNNISMWTLKDDYNYTWPKGKNSSQYYITAMYLSTSIN